VTIAFYLAAAVALVATVLLIGGRNPVHALLYLVVSLLAVALIFFLLGAPFAAALEVIVYAGAIMVLFLFVVMMLSPQWDEGLRRPQAWAGPALLIAVLLVELLYLFALGLPVRTGAEAVGPKAVGTVLLGPYLLAVELASMLLLAGLVGAWHLGRPEGRR
jgi:NADH-quinone oxidoreductase subunit J